jgi:hypothetical protein
MAYVRIAGDRRRGRRPVERHGLATERLGETQHIDAPVARRLRQPEQRRGLHVHHRPLGIERVRHALSGPHQLGSLLVRPDRHQHPVAGDAHLRALCRRQGP